MFKKIVWLWFSVTWKKRTDVKQYISSLVAGGANEFFTGYNPSYWSDRFGFEVSPNGRFAEHEQITDIETLKQIVEEVHSYNLEVFINLNAWYYTDETWPFILRMLDEFQEVWVDGIICWNISILEHLDSIGYTGKINISTILAAYNTESIKFYLENYTINKIILSREVTLKEIEILVNGFPETKFEVFWEGDFCRYNNGLCFAEHKYGAKDICTVVLNDLIIKKKFQPWFKKILLDDNLNTNQKIESFDDNYQDPFQKIENILTQLVLFPEETSLIETLTTIVKQNAWRVDLYFDACQEISAPHNKKIMSFLKAIKTINLPEYQELQAQLELSIRNWMKELSQQLKTIGWPKLKAQEIASLYSKWDYLNLHSYLFFDQFKNIETVKFPTRGRNYNEKIKIIEDTIKQGNIDKKYINQKMSLERTHYDLTYLFGKKLWFREMLEKITQ